MNPVLYDAVTLRHFAVISRIDIVKNRHKNRPEPRWTEGVYLEIKRAAVQTTYCTAILQEPWLGVPVNPTEVEAKEIYLIQTALKSPGDPLQAHLGEAQSIYFAKKLRGQFATDDNAAYKLAEQQSFLGSANVIDSIDILREAVALYEITAKDADQIANDIEANGRHLRRIHSQPRGPNYFSI